MATTKTALQVVNLVMRNLRKTDVTVFTAEYSKLVLELVNQSKREIEDMIDWSHLRGNLTFSTPLNQQAYDLSAAGTTPTITSSVTRFANERSRISYDKDLNPQVFDVTSATSPVRLREYGAETLYGAGIMGQQSSQTQPYGFSFSTPAGIPTLRLLNPPPAGRSMIVRMHLPSDDLSGPTDVLYIPFAPVVMRATALAFDERGEELGSPLTDWTARYEAALQEAIDRDTPVDQQTYYAD